MDNDTIIGGYGKLQPDMVTHVINLIGELDSRYTWNNGSTALFWNIIATLNSHIDAPKE